MPNKARSLKAKVPGPMSNVSKEIQMGLLSASAEDHGLCPWGSIWSDIFWRSYCDIG